MTKSTNHSPTAHISFSYELRTIDDIELRQLRDQWILPELLVRKLECQYLLYWNKQFLVDKNCLRDGIVMSHQGRKYITILAGQPAEFAVCSRIALSFRHPKNTKFGYVLIKPAIKRNGVESEH